MFTPERIVKDMCDMLEHENENAFDISSTFLEPTCGDGSFVIEILKRKFEKCKSKNDYTQAIKSVYGMEIQADNVNKTIERVIKLCCDYFRPTKEQIALIQDHIIQCDSLKIMKMIAEMNCEKRDDNASGK